MVDLINCFFLLFLFCVVFVEAGQYEIRAIWNTHQNFCLTFTAYASVDNEYKPAQQPITFGAGIRSPLKSELTSGTLELLVLSDERLISKRTYPNCWIGPNATVRAEVNQKGEVYAFDWVPGVSQKCEPIGDSYSSQLESSTLVFRRPTELNDPGQSNVGSTKMVPETGSSEDSGAQQQQNQQQQGDDDSENTEQQEDTRSFIQKYWMYIVPVVLILLLSGGGPENPASQPSRSAAAAADAPK